MQNDWILDVLTDLKAFAATNGLSQLSETLEDALVIATAELAYRSAKTQQAGYGKTGETDADTGRAGRQRLA